MTCLMTTFTTINSSPSLTCVTFFGCCLLHHSGSYVMADGSAIGIGTETTKTDSTEEVMVHHGGDMAIDSIVIQRVYLDVRWGSITRFSLQYITYDNTKCLHGS